VGPSPAVGGNLVFALNEYASLVAIKPETAPQKVWEDYSYLSDVPSPVATDKHLFVATSYGLVACFDNLSGEMLWEAEFDNSIYASPMIAEGKVFLLDKQGIMHIFEAGESYQHIADCSLGEGSVCTPAFADGSIYIRGENHLFCIKQ
jgi:outer membrane protein assembly factor BamB